MHLVFETDDGFECTTYYNEHNIAKLLQWIADRGFKVVRVYGRCE